MGCSESSEGGAEDANTSPRESIPDVGRTVGDALAPVDAAPEGVDGAVTPPDAGGPDADGGVPPDAALEDAAADPTEASPCGEGAQVVDLNRHLEEVSPYDGDLTGAPAAFAGTCGGAAGGEIVFAFRVDRQLDRVIFSTRHPETTAPTVLYLRRQCQAAADLMCNRGGAEPGTALTLEAPEPGRYFLVVDTSSRADVGPFRLTAEVVAPPACRDSEDNDGDGLIDAGDPGCAELEDPDEVDPDEPPA